MRALITGGTGFVGKFLAEHLTESRDEILVTYGGKGAGQIPGSEALDVCSSSEVSYILSKFKPDAIYHLAGISFVPQAEEDFELALKVNVLGTSNIFRQAHLLEKPITIVLVSSAEVYGAITAGEVPVSENAVCRPANNYSLSKSMSELVAERYARMGIVKSVIARPFNHIGPGQDPRFMAPSFAIQLARISLGLAEPVIRVGNLDVGRDFSDVRDIVRAYRLGAQKGAGIYNFGSGRPTMVKAILETLIRVSGLSVKVEVDAERYRKVDVPEIYADIRKAEKELGWKPVIPLEDTLKLVYEDAVVRVKSELGARGMAA